jgi:hypothetical protein
MWNPRVFLGGWNRLRQSGGAATGAVENVIHRAVRDNTQRGLPGKRLCRNFGGIH